MNNKKDKKILLVAAGMKDKKKNFMNADAESLYLNYGLLGLGTKLYEKGYKSVRMFQGDFKKVDTFIDEIYEDGIDIALFETPILVSIPSFLAVTWAIEFIEKVKKIKNSIKIIMGGRWVIDNNLNWMKNKFPIVDYFCLGCPDEYIDELLDPKNWNKHLTKGKAVEPFKFLNYNILHNFNQYQPVIEVSRGCGMKCAFCLEKDYPVSRIKSAEDVITETQNICTLYKKEDLNFYFESSLFNPSLEWSTTFNALYKQNNMKFKWRFTTRVDTLNPKVLKILSQAGLKVIDLGLESGSVNQLKAMNKSKCPEEYLKKADYLIQEMHRVNVWAKLNILIYLGENNDTINQTIEWLNKRKTFFKGISINPLILYLNGDKTNEFLITVYELSKKKPNIEKLNEKGGIFIDLSPEISKEKAKFLSKQISDRFMSSQDFEDLKEICYTRLQES